MFALGLSASSALVVVGVAGLPSGFGEGAGWETVAESGLKLERQRGSDGIDTFRASQTVDLPSEALLEAIADVEAWPDFVPHVTESSYLRDGDPVSTYMVIKPPLVKARDYVLQVWRRQLVDGVHERSFRTHPSGTSLRAPRSGHVRLNDIRGFWRVQPVDDTQTRFTYVIRSNPGGPLPKWVRSWINKKSIPDMIDAMLTRARSLRPKLH